MTEIVKKLALSVLNNPTYTSEISYLMKYFDISLDEIIKTWVYWDTGINEYTNEVYKSHALRLVMHLHNYLPNSWHEKRQRIVLEYLSKIHPSKICDIGFGTPQLYVKNFLNSEDVSILLTDFDRSSIDFAKKVISYWDKKENINNVQYQIFDINNDQLPSDCDTYIFQDSIEHALEPSLKLSEFVNIMPKNSHQIFSLPIEISNPIPEHNIFWKDESEVENWLKNSGLSILFSDIIKMNLKVDIFASKLHPNFREVLFLTKKLK